MQCRFFAQFDDNADGEVSLDEFRNMIRTCRTAADLFTGNEELHQLTSKQLKALLLFSNWPKKHEGPADIGESEGLGGLVNVAQVFPCLSLPIARVCSFLSMMT